MARKKKHEEHANHERWLVSYADFITLLFAFFVVLFSSSQVDRTKTKKMALAIESAFSTFSLFEKTGGQLNIMADPNISPATAKKKFGREEGAPIFVAPSLLVGAKEESPELPLADPKLDEGSGVPMSQDDAMKRIHQSVQDLLKMRKADDKVKVKVGLDQRGIVIGVTSSGAFQTGSGQLAPEAMDILKGIAEILVKENNNVRVEAHTDNQGDALANWHLSTLRAVSVIQWMVDHYNLDPARFEAVGYGEYRPIASNDTAEGRDQNRRVEIVLLAPKPEANQEVTKNKESFLKEAKAPVVEMPVPSEEQTQDILLPDTGKALEDFRPVQNDLPQLKAEKEAESQAASQE